MSNSVSVIVPSYNGAKKLPNILKALSGQTYQDFELIVVLDGSTDNSAEVVKPFADKFKNFRLIDRDNGGRAVARNTGAKAAEGELLIFFDDDMRPTPSCVEMHVEHHKDYTSSLLVGNASEDLKLSKTDIQKYRAYLSRKWILNLKPKEKLSEERFFLAAANFSLPKLIFYELEGFDDNLNDAEDFDLGIRAFIKKIPIYFDKENIAWHDDFITMASYIKRQQQYKKSHEVLKALKPELYAQFNQYEYQKVSGVKKSIYWVFSHDMWVWSVDNFNWLKVFPRQLRYKLYDIIITAKAVHFPS